jgi:hypothetical protein
MDRSTDLHLRRFVTDRGSLQAARPSGTAGGLIAGVVGSKRGSSPENLWNLSRWCPWLPGESRGRLCSLDSGQLDIPRIAGREQVTVFALVQNYEVALQATEYSRAADADADADA